MLCDVMSCHDNLSEIFENFAHLYRVRQDSTILCVEIRENILGLDIKLFELLAVMNIECMLKESYQTIMHCI